MKPIYAIFSTYIKNWIRSRTAFFFSLIFPLIFLLIFSSIFGGTTTSKYTLYIQNQDFDEEGNFTALSQVYIKVLNLTGSFKIKEIPSNEDAVKYVKEINKGRLESKIRILIIPKGFHENATILSIKTQVKIQIEFLKRSLNYTKNETQREQILQALVFLNNFYKTLPNKTLNVKFISDAKEQDFYIINGIIKGLNDAFLKRLVGIEADFKLKEEILVEKRFKAVDYYLSGLIAAFIMTNSLFGLAPSIAGMRKLGIVKRLIATPLRKYEWFFGLTFSVIFINFVMLTILIVFGKLIFDATISFNFLWFLLLIVGILFFSGIGIFIGNMVKEVESASVIVNVIAFPMMFLSGAFWPIEIMPIELQYVAKALPLYYYHTGLRNLFIFEDIELAMLSFIILPILTAVFLILAIITLRWEEK